MVEAVGKGSILMETRVKGFAWSIRMHDVFHISSLHSNLLSMSKPILRDLKVHFNLWGCVVRTSNGNMLAVALLESNLYQLDTDVGLKQVLWSFGTTDWDISTRILWKMLQSMVSKMDVRAAQDDVHTFTCEGWVEGKQARWLFPMDGGTRSTKILELVHSSVCRLMTSISIGGVRYFLTFIDNFLCKICMYVLKTKNEVLTRFRKWRTLLERQSEHVMMVLRMDNSGKYMSKTFDDFLSKHGIAWQASSPYALQQNSVMERANRIIVEMVWSMIHTQYLTHECR